MSIVMEAPRAWVAIYVGLCHPVKCIVGPIEQPAAGDKGLQEWPRPCLNVWPAQLDCTEIFGNDPREIATPPPSIGLDAPGGKPLQDSAGVGGAESSDGVEGSAGVGNIKGSEGCDAVGATAVIEGGEGGERVGRTEGGKSWGR